VLLENLKHRINQRVETLLSHMGAGRCEDYQDYKYLSGQIEAYKQMIEMIREVNKQLEDLDDEDSSQ